MYTAALCSNIVSHPPIGWFGYTNWPSNSKADGKVKQHYLSDWALPGFSAQWGRRDQALRDSKPEAVVVWGQCLVPGKKPGHRNDCVIVAWKALSIPWSHPECLCIEFCSLPTALVWPVACWPQYKSTSRYRFLLNEKLVQHFWFYSRLTAVLYHLMMDKVNERDVTAADCLRVNPMWKSVWK